MTDNEDDEIKIVFAPGALEALEEEMDPEELQEFLDNLKASIDDGSFFEQSNDVNWETLAEEDPEAYKKISEALESVPESREDYKKKLN